MIAFTCALLLAVVAPTVDADGVLTPYFFDIAKGNKISATATCGEDYTPMMGESNEKYCTLASVHCDYCRPGVEGEFT